MRLKHVCSLYGDYGLNISADEYVEKGIPIIRTSDFDDLGRLNLSDPKMVSEDAASPKMLRRGDILFSRAGTIGRCTTYNNDNPATFAAYLVRFRPNNSMVEPRFIGWWAQSQQYWSQIRADTIESTIGNFNAAKLGNLVLPDIALDTQQAIAHFLDRETARIDQLIEKKQRLVEVLSEGLAASLEKATTPTHTIFEELIPFRWVCRIAEGQVDPTESHWVNKPLIAPNHIQSRTGRLLHIETAEEQGAISGKYAYPRGTVLYSKIRPALAKSCIAPQSGMCSADMYPILPDKRFSPQFLLMQLLSRKFTDWATLESMRVAMPKINRETLGNYRFWVPQRDTQDRLAQIYNTERSRIDAVSEKVSISISRLREFRSALITAAVTGQMDVTSWGKKGQTDRRLDEIEEAMRA